MKFGSFHTPASKPPPFQCLRTAFTFQPRNWNVLASKSHTLECPPTPCPSTKLGGYSQAITHPVQATMRGITDEYRHRAAFQFQSRHKIKLTMSALPCLQILFLFLKIILNNNSLPTCLFLLPNSTREKSNHLLPPFSSVT